MRYFKIAPDVACCAYKSGVLHDKNIAYPETMWPEGEALQRVARGFLVEVKQELVVTSVVSSSDIETNTGKKGKSK